MSGLEEWLARRRPAPPTELEVTMRSVDEVKGLHVSLLEAARTRLSAARARSGRVRESAFKLLEADALFTYACEAALDTDDPEAELRRILIRVGP